MNPQGRLLCFTSNILMLIYEIYDFSKEPRYICYKFGLLIPHVIMTYILYRNLTTAIKYQYIKIFNKSDKIFLLDSNRYPFTVIIFSLVIYLFIFTNVYVYDWLNNISDNIASNMAHTVAHTVAHGFINNSTSSTGSTCMMSCVTHYSILLLNIVINTYVLLYTIIILSSGIVFVLQKINNILYKKITNADATHIEYIKCQICDQNIKDNHFLGICEHSFHEFCYNKLMKYVNYKCPTCGEQLSKTNKVV